METFLMAAIIFQILGMCAQSFALGYAKFKLPGGMIIANMFVFAVNFALIAYNISTLMK